MRFSKILKRFAGLGLFLIVQNLSAQEEFIEATPPPPTDGLFDDQLEPLDEVEPVRPQAPANVPSDSAQIDNGFPDSNPDFNDPSPIPTFKSASDKFPSPKPITAPKGKSLPPLPFGAIPNPNEKVRLDFVQVELEEILKYFAERVQKRFIYDPSILSGKVTIISPTDVTLQEAWGAFLSALEVRGYIVFPAGDFLKLEKAANARKAPVPVVTGETPNDDSFVTRIITLKYLNVNDIRQAVRNLLSRTAGDVIEHPQTNTLILSDYAFNIRRIVRILNILDVEGFQEQITVIPLKFASASDVARKVTDFFPAGSGGSGRFRSRAAEGSVGIPSTAGSSGAQTSVVSKIVPDDRTNSLIVLGSERGVDQVRKFVEQLDVPVEGGGGQIHVYYLQNVKAEDISQTLAALAQGLSKSNRGGTTGNLGGSLPAPGLPPPGPNPGGPTTASLLSGEVKITADAPTNSLVIQASPRDFDVLKSIIQKLDIRRRQVFIESAILEASVSRGSAFGIQAAGPLARTDILQKDATSASDPAVKSAGIFSLGPLASSLDNLLQSPDKLTGLALGFRSGGTFDMSVTDPATGETKTRKVPLLTAIIRLAASANNLNVLSTPHILATANEEATISIGQEIPQITNSTLTDGGNTTRSYTRVRVATELNITPQINADDYLTLKIKQKVNSVGEKGDDGQYNTINREATTTAIVKDQQTIVIGGLMEDRKTVRETKVPFLGDIPILGWLFKDRETANQKVNLLLFLTPHVIKDTADMNDQFFRKIKERERFLKEVGMDEKKGVPISGLTDQQMKMLDKEYLKSIRRLELEKLPHETVIEQPIVEPSKINPSEVEKTMKVIEPIKPEAKSEPAMPETPLAPVPPPAEAAPPRIETPAVEIPVPVPPPVAEPAPVLVPPAVEPQKPALVQPAPVAPPPPLEPPPSELQLEDSPPEGQ